MTNGEKYRTAQERAEAFKKFCYQRQRTDSRYCEYHGENHCPLCTMKWLDLEAEEEKPLPCPFCGAGCYAIDHHSPVGFRYKIWCSQCSYSSMQYKSRDEAIAAHNRVAKKCREVVK